MNTIKLAPLLLIFVEVAKMRSFTQAAKKLGLSKSAISQQIKRLEAATDQQLLVRNTRGVVLTSVGEKLLAKSELLSEQLSMTLTELDSEKEQPSGSFRVSVPPFFEKNIVVPAMAQLCTEFPLISPEILVNGRWQDLIEHNLDAAIFGGDLKDSNYRALSIGKVSERFCASPRYIKQHGTPNQVSDLTQHKFIATPWQHDKLQLMDIKQNTAFSFELNHFAKTNTPNTALEMVLNDMGIAILPEFLMQPHLLGQKLELLLPETRGRAWHFYFLHQFMAEKPAHVTRFYQLICHYFQQKMLLSNSN
ncbi:LysR family transcriptional regulator [Marinomonas sp. MED121]|uniref:LysR family transcriptional regulator n=1 Tax=Marinomonas sp. MED121 TaxID=314277 RepID=UPI0002E8A05E|nr:LysR family transcriptional regulator [Marinomonas sp. MED121]